MNEKTKDSLLHAACCAEEVMRYLWRAYFAAKYNDAKSCIDILKALHATYADARWLNLIKEVRKEQTNE